MISRAASVGATAVPSLCRRTVYGFISPYTDSSPTDLPRLVSSGQVIYQGIQNADVAASSFCDTLRQIYPMVGTHVLFVDIPSTIGWKNCCATCRFLAS